MTTRVLVDRGSWDEADGMRSPAGVDGCMPWAELVASTAERPCGGDPDPALARAPGALQCLRCQLLGRRSLTCARRDLCLERPPLHPVGPLLLVAWLVTAAAFVTSVW